MRTVLSIVAFLTWSSCVDEGDQTSELQYLFIKKSGQMDTIYRQLKFHSLTDSVSHIAYQTIWDDNKFDEEFRLPTSKAKSIDDIRLLEEKIIEFEGREYVIFKYLLNSPYSGDDQMLYFYSKEFGILINKSAWWGNYDKLTRFGTSEDNRVIYFLTEMITNDDKDFWIKW